MSEVETKGQRMARLARPVRTLTEALGIDKRRYLFLATILTESFKNDESAMDSIKTVLDLLHDEKITKPLRDKRKDEKNKARQRIKSKLNLTDNDIDQLYTEDAAEVTKTIFGFIEKYFALAKKMWSDESGSSGRIK